MIEVCWVPAVANPDVLPAGLLVQVSGGLRVSLTFCRRGRRAHLMPGPCPAAAVDVKSGRKKGTVQQSSSEPDTQGGLVIFALPSTETVC